MCYFILSCIYAKNSGFDIAVHCDERAKAFLELAPYDDIITDLEGVKAPANSKIYAWGKFAAMRNEDIGNIHIDGDVFLKSSKLKDILNYGDCDCIVQSLENKYSYGGDVTIMWRNNESIFSGFNKPSWAKSECNYMYNCGVIGINNVSLKKEYFDTYDDIICQYNESGIFMDASVPDIIVEQQYLKDLTDYKQYKVKSVLPCDNVFALQMYSTSIGYQHIIGDSKRKNLEKVLKIIKYYDKGAYTSLLELKSELNIK
jgi:hypothetical protein